MSFLRAETIGDDPYLDSLYNQCADGDDWACELLWEESPIDSEYEFRINVRWTGLRHHNPRHTYELWR